MKEKKTFWPYGILLILLLGLVLLVGLVFISQYQMNPDDNSYTQGYNFVDQNINEILSATKEFMKNYDIHSQLDTREFSFIAPYLEGSKQVLPLSISSNTPHKIHLTFEKKSNSDIEIKKYSLYLSRFYDKKYQNHFDLLQIDKEGFILPAQKVGRIRVIAEIQYIQDNLERTIFLQRDFLVR